MLPYRHICNYVWFSQVAEEEKPAEVEKETEKTEDVQPDKDDADEETDVADRRPTLQRNYNADDSNPLPSTDTQRRGRTDSSMRTPASGGPRSAGPGAQGGPGGPGGPGGAGGPRRFPKERGFLVRVSNPPGQHVCLPEHFVTSSAFVTLSLPTIRWQDFMLLVIGWVPCTWIVSTGQCTHVSANSFQLPCVLFVIVDRLWQEVFIFSNLCMCYFVWRRFKMRNLLSQCPEFCPRLVILM